MGGQIDWLEAQGDAEEATGGALVSPSRIRDICNARDRALALYADAAKTLQAGFAMSGEALKVGNLARMGAQFYFNDRTHSDHYARMFGGKFDAEKSLDVIRKELDAGIWTHLLDSTGLAEMMDRQAREEFDKSLAEDVPEVTAENIAATLEHLGGNADLIFARGLANAFSKLDARFKSHDAFKIGARIIMTRVFDDWGTWNYHSRARETLCDVERVFAVLDGKAPNGSALLKAIEESRGRGLDPRQSETHSDYFLIRGFKNGNAHVWFTRDDLVEKANKVLAGYYGEVLPDAAEKDADPDEFKSRSGLPSKDLAFYETPQEAIDHLMDRVSFTSGASVLEPSAGRGAIVRALAKRGATVHAVEIHAGRCAELKAAGASIVHNRNFLNMKPLPMFGAVVMNPPFNGTHWMEHVAHAWEFVEPGGSLVAILPATAEVAETAKHAKFRRWVGKVAPNWGSGFYSLPPESFAASGTRIQTVILRMDKRH